MNRLLFALLLAGQTTITPPANKYSPADDVKLGQQAKAEVQKQLPIMSDDAITSYVEGLGRRLVAVIPSNLQHPEFRYTFDTVNVREINAFALPGGPMFVNRGMIEAAKTEGEVAGVMAHELSHVILRHGTAQASKATKYEVGTIAGAVLGAIIGGNLGNIVAQGTQFGLGAAFLRFSREFERQADIEGAHIMAAAGYDPREMANMFKTIAKQGGSGAPQWLSDHPDPGNRQAYITKEAELLRVDNPVRDTRGFEQVKAHLKRLPAAPTTEQATKNGGRNSGQSGGQSQPPPTGRVAPPSSQFKTYTEGDLFRVSVPANWRELPGSGAVTFAPDGAYGQTNGQSVFTHGVEIGATRNETQDLRTATDELIASLASGNANLGRPAGYSNVTVAGRRGLRTTMSNRSEINGQPETIQVFTTLMRDGSVLHVIGVAPSDSFSSYQNIFQRVVGSLQLMD